MSDWNPVIQEVLASSDNATPPEPVRENLIHIYFQFVDPVIPILHKSSFFHQLRNGQPISKLLLNAIYCVSSRWDLGFPTISEEPRGWAFYQNAVSLLDQQKEVKLSTVQGLFLLLKYNEHVRRPGFIWRTRYYFQMIVRMCKDLGLPREIICTSSNLFIEIEKRKRTFWAVYCYDVMMRYNTYIRTYSAFVYTYRHVFFLIVSKTARHLILVMQIAHLISRMFWPMKPRNTKRLCILYY